jgi:transcriptional regulator with XRE-family HTH domain
MELLNPIISALKPLSQIEIAGVASRSNVSVTTLNAVCRGVTKNPGLSTFADIARACGYELVLVPKAGTATEKAAK